MAPFQSGSVTMFLAHPAYRIHISLNTVKVLTSLKLGYHMETRKAQVPSQVLRVMQKS